MELQENYASFQKLDAEIVAIAQLERDPEMLGRIEKFVGNSFPIVADPEQQTRRPFKIFGIYLIDKEGVLRTYIPGTKEARPRLDLILSELGKLQGVEAPRVDFVEGKAVVAESADPSSSQWPVQSKEDVVRVRWMFSHDRVRPGDELRLAFLPKIAPGYHIYGPQDEVMKPFRVELTLPDGLSLDRPLAYPPPKSIRDEALGKLVTHYSSDIPMPVIRLKASEELSQGELRIQALVTYQACDESSCFPPATQTLTLTIPGDVPDARRGQVFGWQTW